MATEKQYPKVVAAAIVGHDGVVVSLPQPARHYHVIIHMVHILGHPIPITGEQGFMLSDGKFARRTYARRCAVANDQLLPRAMKLPELYSEDVW